LLHLTRRLFTDRSAVVFVGKLLVAFLPAAIVGVMFRETMQARLFFAAPVAVALIVGGILMFAIEQFLPPREEAPVEQISWLQALGVGLFQILSLWPGFSRSAATIMGGMILGLDRSRSTVFSFYLAIPTLCGATVYETYKSRNDLSMDDLGWFALGTLVSFVVALIVIKGMLAYVRRFSFRPLAVYRIVLGIVVLAINPTTHAESHVPPAANSGLVAPPK
jgi:undecaprenyl-diphosphatase